MSPEWIYFLALTIALSATGFVCLVLIWLRKLRESVSSALAEAAGHQIRTAQRLNESLAEVRKQQDHYNHQIHTLAQAGLRLQQELSTVTHRLDNTQSDATRGSHTLH